MTIIKHTAFILISSAIVLLLGPEARSNEFRYPVCSDVAHITQEAWQRGELTEAEARGIIDRCLRWEDAQ